MHGIITSKPFAARTGHLAWADVPGVTYPAEAYAAALEDGASTAPAPAPAAPAADDDPAWISTDAARRLCRYASNTTTRNALHAAGVEHRKGISPRKRVTLLWARAGVETVARRHKRALRRAKH